jgi:hypothetical protein
MNLDASKGFVNYFEEKELFIIKNKGISYAGE